MQRFYNLSDDQVEYQINDRMSFMPFLDLTISDDVPDSKTVWNFREKLINSGIIDDLFFIFMDNLEKLGLIVNQGRIIDAIFVEVPRQRNKKEDNDAIKRTEVPESFKENQKNSRKRTLTTMNQEEQRELFWLQKPHQDREFGRVLSTFLDLWSSA